MEKAKDLYDKMSEEDVQEYISMCHRSSSKPLFQVVSDILKEHNEHELSDAVLSRAHNKCDSVAIEFMMNKSSTKLCVCLAAIDIKYNCEIYLPQSFDKYDELYENINLLKIICVTYWEHFKKTDVLYPQIASKIGDLNLEEVDDKFILRFAGKHTHHRIGIFHYYVDHNGQHLVRK